MKKRISLIFCVMAALVCLLSIGAAAATFAPDNDGLYTVALDMEPNCEYSLFVIKGVYDQTNYIEAYRAAEDSDILYFEQKNSESDGSVTFGPFAPVGYYAATLVLGGTNLDEPVIAGYLSVEGVSNAAGIVLSGIEQSYTVEGLYGVPIQVEIEAQVLDSFGYPSMVDTEVEFELINNTDGVTIDGNVITIERMAKAQAFTVKATAGDAVKTANVLVNRRESVYAYIELYYDEACMHLIGDDALTVVGVAGNYPDVSVYAKSFDQYGEEMTDEYVYTYGNKNVETTFTPVAGTLALVVNSVNSPVSNSVDVIASERPDYAGSALELFNLIAECRQALENRKNISAENGRDIFPSETWTTQTAVDAFAAAISIAAESLDKYGTAGYNDNDYADEVTALTKALDTYNASFKAGTRVDYESISVDITEAKLLPRDEITLKVTTTPSKGTTDVLTWKSSDEAVATVTAGSGGRATVTAKAYGKATITVTTRGGLTATTEITVVKKTTRITMTPSKATATYGSAPVVLEAHIQPNDYTDVIEWNVEKPEVADVKTEEYVDEYGERYVYVTIIPKSAGNTDITVSSQFGAHSATSEITVVMPAWPTAAAPKASVESGSVLAGTKVSLSSATANTKIYYTLDGSEPTVENGRLYTTPISVGKNLVLKAIATGEELYNSSVSTYEYRVVDTSVTVDGDTIRSGETANIKVNIAEFENVKEATIMVKYDPEYVGGAVTLVPSAPDGVTFEYAVIGNLIQMRLSKEDGFTLDGVIANVSLAYKADAPEGNYAFDITTAEVKLVGGEVYTAATRNGSVVINNFIAGDANDDGKISLADVLLIKQYLAGNENAKRLIVLGAADVDADGDVDNGDVTLLSRYCVGWNVTLGKQPEEYRVISNYDLTMTDDGEWTISYELYNPYTGAKVYEVPSVDVESKASNLTAIKEGTMVNLVDGKVDKDFCIDVTGDNAYVPAEDILTDNANLVWIADVDTVDEYFTVVPYTTVTDREAAETYVEEKLAEEAVANDMYGDALPGSFIDYDNNTVVSVMSYGEYNASFWKWGSMSRSNMSAIANGKKEVLCYNDEVLDENDNYVTKYSDYVKAYVSVDRDVAAGENPVAEFVIVIVHSGENAAQNPAA